MCAILYPLHTTSTDFKPNVYSYGERERTTERSITHPCTLRHVHVLVCSCVCIRCVSECVHATHYFVGGEYSLKRFDRPNRTGTPHSKIEPPANCIDPPIRSMRHTLSTVQVERHDTEKPWFRDRPTSDSLSRAFRSLVSALSYCPPPSPLGFELELLGRLRQLLLPRVSLADLEREIQRVVPKSVVASCKTPREDLSKTPVFSKSSASLLL